MPANRLAYLQIRSINKVYTFDIILCSTSLASLKDVRVFVVRTYLDDNYFYIPYATDKASTSDSACNERFYRQKKIPL